MTGCKDETLSSSECCCQHAPDLIAPIVGPIVKKRDEATRIAQMSRLAMGEVQAVEVTLTLGYETRTVRCPSIWSPFRPWMDFKEEKKWVLSASKGMPGRERPYGWWKLNNGYTERVYGESEYERALADFDSMVKKYGLKSQREWEEQDVEEKMRQYLATGPVG